MSHSQDEIFAMLSPGIQAWVARQGWPGFRDIQTQSIQALLGTGDPANLVISAPTASGKTEAAFMPMLSMTQTYLEEHRTDSFVFMLYVAPLKALINDQFRRMTEMAAHCNIPVYLWHGDAPIGPKKQMLKSHAGIIMITPESLESFLINRGSWCNDYMTPLSIVVDEFHVFLDSGRGKQLLSLLDRIDAINVLHGKKPAVRIGLSATLSKLDLVGRILSPRSLYSVIDGSSIGKDETDVNIATFVPPDRKNASSPKTDYHEIGERIIEESVGVKTLTFAKSRMAVETLSSAINDICQEKKVPSEAFPHHGSLSKETRESLEKRLVNTDKPTMAVATTTLELGIDIGDINKVFQVDPPNSVASLRQRLGRSGRRDGLRKLECLITLGDNVSEMEESLTVMIAEILLMREGWFEPPASKRRDASVLISEILSVVSQYHTAYPEELFDLLVERGAFTNVTGEMFSMVIDDMVTADFLAFSPDGQVMMSLAGEKEINDWHFYATFQSEESYSVRHGKKTIGEITPPITSLNELAHGGMFMLGGKNWQVLPPIDMKNKVINVKPSTSKSSFLIPISRGGGDVCGHIKRKRISLLNGKDSKYVPEFLDEDGKKQLEEARSYANTHCLNGLGLMVYDIGEKGSETDTEISKRLVTGYSDPNAVVSCSPPVDSDAYDAIQKMMEFSGMIPGGFQALPLYRLHELIESALNAKESFLIAKESLIEGQILGELTTREKYNGILSPETLKAVYAEELMDVEGAVKWMNAFERFYCSLPFNS